jgi:RNA polymerase sigma factor (TIGR02999 family)
LTADTTNPFNAPRATPVSDVTRILTAIQCGDMQAADDLLPIIYQELRLLASQMLSREPPGQTLQATALVHEAYIRLLGSEDPGWQGRRHFFAAAAEAMRRILVDNARRKKSIKHGGDRQRLDIHLDTAGLVTPGDADDLVALDEALSRLAEQHPEEADLVKLRFFAGLTAGEAAKALDISLTTAKRRWRYARAWLYRGLSEGPAGSGD